MGMEQPQSAPQGGEWYIHTIKCVSVE